MYLSKTKVMRAKLQKIRYIVEHCAIFIFLQPRQTMVPLLLSPDVYV